MNSRFAELTVCADFAATHLNRHNEAGAATTCEHTDYDLVRDAMQGNHAAFAELVRTHDRAILRLALHLTRSHQDAQDLCQETFLKAYRNLSRFRFESSFATWLHRIATNSCLGYLRKQRNRKTGPSASSDADNENADAMERVPDEHPLSCPERALLNGEQRDHLILALQTLTERERMLFEFRHYHGLKLRAAAALLNTSEASAKTALFRATRKLRRRLAFCRVTGKV